MSKYCMGHTYMKKLLIAYLKFKCDCVSCILPASTVWNARNFYQAFAQSGLLPSEAHP